MSCISEIEFQVRPIYFAPPYVACQMAFLASAPSWVTFTQFGYIFELEACALELVSKCLQSDVSTNSSVMSRRREVLVIKCLRGGLIEVETMYGELAEEWLVACDELVSVSPGAVDEYLLVVIWEAITHDMHSHVVRALHRRSSESMRCALARPANLRGFPEVVKAHGAKMERI